MLPAFVSRPLLQGHSKRACDDSGLSVLLAKKKKGKSVKSPLSERGAPGLSRVDVPVDPVHSLTSRLMVSLADCAIDSREKSARALQELTSGRKPPSRHQYQFPVFAAEEQVIRKNRTWKLVGNTAYAFDSLDSSPTEPPPALSVAPEPDAAPPAPAPLPPVAAAAARSRRADSSLAGPVCFAAGVCMRGDHAWFTGAVVMSLMNELTHSRFVIPRRYHGSAPQRRRQSPEGPSSSLLSPPEEPHRSSPVKARGVQQEDRAVNMSRVLQTQHVAEAPLRAWVASPVTSGAGRPGRGGRLLRCAPPACVTLDVRGDVPQGSAAAAPSLRSADSHPSRAEARVCHRSR